MTALPRSPLAVSLLATLALVAACGRGAQSSQVPDTPVSRAPTEREPTLTPDDTALVANVPSDCDADAERKIRHWQRSTGLLTRAKGGGNPLDRESAALATIMAVPGNGPSQAQLSDADGATVGYLRLREAYPPLLDRPGLYCLRMRYDAGAALKPNQTASARGWSAEAVLVRGIGSPTPKPLTVVMRESDTAGDTPPNIARFVFLADWMSFLGRYYMPMVDSAAFGRLARIGDGGWLRCASGCCSTGLDF
jgi:hypothetical protein